MPSTSSNTTIGMRTHRLRPRASSGASTASSGMIRSVGSSWSTRSPYRLARGHERRRLALAPPLRREAARLLASRSRSPDAASVRSSSRRRVSASAFSASASNRASSARRSSMRSRRWSPRSRDFASFASIFASSRSASPAARSASRSAFSAALRARRSARSSRLGGGASGTPGSDPADRVRHVDRVEARSPRAGGPGARS